MPNNYDTSEQKNEHKQPTTWAFLMPGTGEDIIETQERLLERAEQRMAQIDKALAGDISPQALDERDIKTFERINAAKKYDEASTLKSLGSTDDIALVNAYSNLKEQEGIKNVLAALEDLEQASSNKDQAERTTRIATAVEELKRIIRFENTYTAHQESIGNIYKSILSALSQSQNPDKFWFALMRYKAQLAKSQQTFPNYSDVYTKEMNAVIKNAMNSGFGISNKLYKAPESARVEILQAVGTKTMNPWGMDPKTGKIAKRPGLLSLSVGFLTGKGEKENIEYCLNQLRAAKEKGELPSRIVLNGHSRGSSATIELARAIYLEFSNQIKIAMNINDPVPGAFRHMHSKMVIPPNVDSLVITYAGREDRRLFMPQDLKEIIFNPEKTTVTTLVLPGINHIFAAKTKEAEKQCYNAAVAINEGLWAAINGKGSADMSAISQLHCDPNQKFIGARKDAELVIASDPNKNNNLPDKLKDFHRTLKEKAYSTTPVPAGEYRQPVAEAVKSAPVATALDRKVMLSMMYYVGKKSAKPVKVDQKAFEAWREKIVNHPKEYAEFCGKALQELQRLIEQLQSKKTHYSRKKLALANYAKNMIADIKAINPQTEADYRRVYQQLHVLRHSISKPSIIPKKFLQAGAAGLKFFGFVAPQIKPSSPKEKIFAAVDLLLKPNVKLPASKLQTSPAPRR